MVFADGAGAASQQVIGTAVFGGMVFSTVLTLFIVPVQYVLIKAMAEGLFSRFTKKKKSVAVA
jgi:HAE1 family hydrophobic/amphiphilic exporter-1